MGTFPADCAARFRPVRPLASGGFGAVYLATQVSLGRTAAVKVLHAVDREQVARFLAETRMTTALEAAHARGIVHRDVKPENVMRPRRRATSARSASRCSG